ncbi:tyrosine-type recombinase/integrase [Bifidobacterium mongoliense]|uniref:tyrosine-type recombinase/integrase n=1 Tax=Bifidobacterium mongoliense TaxID=518643 RepID=UPI0026494855|nr:site-specific integrase [Bifidobacterium mongoliense]MDN6050553.1 site-specific integrase [Bifidobacterium mongoliense]
MTTGLKQEYGEGTAFYSGAMHTWVARYPASKMGLGRKISGYGKTEEIAKANRDKALKRAITNTQRSTSNSVGTVLKKYTTWLEATDRKSNTLARKKDRLQRYLKPYMTKSITKLDEDAIIEILAKAKANSKSETYSKIPNQIYSELHQLLEWCLKRGYVEKNPILLVEKPSWKSKARTANEEYIDQRITLGKALLAYTARHASTYGVEYGILLVAALGLRAGEIRGLTWDRFDHLLDDKDCILHVRQQYDRDATTGVWHLVEWAKTDAGTRKIALPTEWKANLADYYDWLYDRQSSAPETYCFITKAGTPFTSGRMNERWKNLKEAFEKEQQKIKPEYAMTDVDKSMRLYDMRHVCASLLVSSGRATIDQVRPILGHTDRRMTEYYTHLTMESERKTMNEIPELMGNTAPNWQFDMEG